MQLQNNKHASDEDVGTYLRRAKMLADALTTSIFNATVYNNLSFDYMERWLITT